RCSIYLRQVYTLGGEALTAGLQRFGHALVDPLLGDAECGGDLLARLALDVCHYEDFSKIWAQLFDYICQMLSDLVRHRLPVRTHAVIRHFFHSCRALDHCALEAPPP